jgi:hypothetical protein
MSQPSVLEVRQRIDSVREEEMRNCFRAAYLFCARIGEVVSEDLPSDLAKGIRARGNMLSATQETYTPNLSNQEEFMALTLSRIAQGKPTGFVRLSKVKEPIAIFKVSTHKRKGMMREIALPLNEEFEPWSVELFNYFKAKEGQSLFPLTRKDAYYQAKRLFGGFTYRILPYTKWVKLKSPNGESLLDEHGKPRKQKLDIPEHYKRFTDHALRHLRASELTNFYGFSGKDRSKYGGWTLATQEGVSGSQDRYVEIGWRVPLAKLLKPCPYHRASIIEA